MRRASVAAWIAWLVVAAWPVGARAQALVRARVFDGVAWHERADVRFSSGGVVESLGPSGSEAAVEIAGAVLTPGLWDLDARLLPGGEDAEIPESAATDLRLLDGLDLSEPARAAFARSGVTTAWLSGAPRVVVAGRAALVQPAPGGAPPRVLRAEWGLSCSLASDARLEDREPSSLPAQVRLLEPLLAAAPGAPHRIRFNDGAGARHAAALGIPLGRPERAEDLVELRGGRGLVASLDWTRATPGTLRTVAAFAGDEPLGLGSGPGPSGPAGVRLAAHRLVEEGASPDAVLRALTSGAAALAGLPALGRLAPGAPADAVLWSGDPLSLASRPLRVWVRGEEVFREK